MRALLRPLGFVVLLSLSVGAAGASEPANLEISRTEVRNYVASGEYERDMAAVSAEAKAWVQQRARERGGKLAIVFDLDETLLSNLPVLQKIAFGFDRDQVAAVWNAGNCPVNPAVRDVYVAARAAGLTVIYITGRSAPYRAGTELNLRKVDCAEYARLICRPDDWHGTTGEYKTQARAQLEQEGYVIVANIGDQASDLEGGHAERTFKLPNPFYLTK